MQERRSEWECSWHPRVWENDSKARERCKRTHQSSIAIKTPYWFSSTKDRGLREGQAIKEACRSDWATEEGEQKNGWVNHYEGRKDTEVRGSIIESHQKVKKSWRRSS